MKFICPINLSIMKEPLMSKSGQNYDRKAILEWLNGGNTNCPLTRQPLKHSLLVPNNALKLRIEKWRQENDIKDDDDGDNDDDSSTCSSPTVCDNKKCVGLLNFAERPSQQYSLASLLATSRGGPRRNSEINDLVHLYNEVLDLANIDDLMMRIVLCFVGVQIYKL